MSHLMIVLAIAASVPPGILPGRTYVAGAGKQTCAAFIGQAGADGLSDPMSLQWVLGYVTGRAAATDKLPRPLPDAEGVARTLLAYCRAHPYARLDSAAASFFERRGICGSARGCR